MFDKMSDDEIKMHAQHACDTILAAEKYKKHPELKKHIKAELKERAKHLESAMGKKAEKSAKPMAKKQEAKKPAKKK